MSYVSRRSNRFVLAFALGTSLAAGCQKQDAPQPVVLPKKFDAPNLPGPVQDSTATEDPDVAGYFKKKGWSLRPDIRTWDGRKLIYLGVENRDKPFENVVLTADDYKMIAKSKTAQGLDLFKAKNTDDGLKTVAGIPQLQAILIDGEEVTDTGIKALANCKNLETITLRFARKVTDAGIKELAVLPKLQVLYLVAMTLKGSAFEAFTGSKALESITLESVGDFTDHGAKQLAKIPNLKELKLHVGGMTPAGIKAIVDTRLPAAFDFSKRLMDDEVLEALVAKGWLPTPSGTGKKPFAKPEDVTEIVFDNSKVTDKGMRSVLRWNNASSLHLDKTGVSDKSLEMLKGFTKLDYLALAETKITGVGFNALTALPVKHAAMDGCTLSEDGFKALGKLTALEELWLREAKMKPEWLKHIAKLPKLKDLGLMSTDFDDEAVKYVATMPNLERLVVHDTKLSDTGLQELLKMPKLKELWIPRTKVSKEAYEKAKKDYPKLSLQY
jgi:hypothetical protein